MRNIKLLAIVALAALLGVISCSKEDSVSSEADENSTARVSENLVEEDPPFSDLNIIGVPQGESTPNLPMYGTTPGTITQENTIFVPLAGRSKILLGKADPGSFRVKDGLATDGSGSFILRSSDIDKDGTSSYSIWAKLVGGKGGVFVCPGDNSAAGEGIYYGFYDVCSAGELTFRVSGSSRFSNVSSQLLYITVPRGKTINLEGNSGPITLTSGKYPVFDDRFEGHYWQLYDPNDTNGSRILKLRLIGN